MEEYRIKVTMIYKVCYAELKITISYAHINITTAKKFSTKILLKKQSECNKYRQIAEVWRQIIELTKVYGCPIEIIQRNKSMTRKKGNSKINHDFRDRNKNTKGRDQQKK